MSVILKEFSAGGMEPCRAQADRAPTAAVELHGLRKTYRIWKDERARLREPLFRAGACIAPTKALRGSLLRCASAQVRDFTAVDDISLSVPKGQCLGIVGRNGSGKSTLLQLICGILKPSSGSLKVRGRVAALLELGSGFNPEFTGRENVFLNASIMGLSQDEVRARFDEIVLFADIGDFVEQPVKTYSSGMMLRLAFAVQILVSPDVLIVDEALSVGDEPFQRKCFARLERLREQGVTVLFVSHDMTPILNLCDRAILLHRGRLMLDSTPKEVASVYQRFNHAPADRADALLEELCSASARSSAESDSVHESTIERSGKEAAHSEFFEPELLPESTQVYDSLGATISDIRILDEDGFRVNHLKRRGIYRYCYRVSFERGCQGVNFAMLIKSIMGVELGGARSFPAYKPIANVGAGSCFDVSFRFQCNLTQGVYCMNAGVEAEIDGRPSYACRVLDALMFRVRPEQDMLPTVTVDFLIEPSVQALEK
ncbi:MAG: ABC transporter ATP-binding protein [Opitutales bacterium]|nr:ABC transporter ATP-binding protein [Opitutales bacterium]